MSLMIPTVHLNGTAGEVLRDQYSAAATAVCKALDAICDAGPNARDYYVQSPDAALAAQREHESRIASLKRVQQMGTARVEQCAEGETCGNPRKIQMTTITEKLAHIEKLATSGPQLSGSERDEYDRIWKRLARASADLRRAKKRGDAKKTASAERSLANASALRDEFLTPKVGHLWAPARIIGKFESRWSGPGVAGAHGQECEMVLDHKDLSGPSYRTVRVLRDEGGPPTNAHSAPDVMGVAWFALKEQITCGKIVVLGEEEPS